MPGFAGKQALSTACAPCSLFPAVQVTAPTPGRCHLLVTPALVTQGECNERSIRARLMAELRRYPCSRAGWRQLQHLELFWGIPAQSEPKEDIAGPVPQLSPRCCPTSPFSGGSPLPKVLVTTRTMVSCSRCTMSYSSMDITWEHREVTESWEPPGLAPVPLGMGTAHPC